MEHVLTYITDLRTGHRLFVDLCFQRCIKSCDVLKSKAGNFLLTDKEDSERSPSGPESFLRGPRTPVGGWGDKTRTTSSSYLLECCTFEGKWEKNGKDHIVIWTNWVLLEKVIILTLFVWKGYIYIYRALMVSLFFCLFMLLKAICITLDGLFKC